MRKIKAILFKPGTDQSNLFTEVTITSNEEGKFLDSIYEHIECNTIDYIDLSNIALGLGAYVDDEGLLRDDFTIGMIYADQDGDVQEYIAGNLLLVNHNKLGETISLTKKQIKAILDAGIGEVVHTNNDDGTIKTNFVLVYDVGY